MSLQQSSDAGHPMFTNLDTPGINLKIKRSFSAEGRPRLHPKLHWWPLRNGQRSARNPWNDSTHHQHNGLLQGRGPWCLGVMLTLLCCDCLTAMHFYWFEIGTGTSILCLKFKRYFFAILYENCIFGLLEQEIQRFDHELLRNAWRPNVLWCNAKVIRRKGLWGHGKVMLETTQTQHLIVYGVYAQ